MFVLFLFKQKTAYEMRISDWSSDVCSSDLIDDDDGAEQLADRRGAARLDRKQTDQDQNRDRQHPFRKSLMHNRQSLDRRQYRDGRRNDGVAIEQREIGRASCRERGCQYV